MKSKVVTIVFSAVFVCGCASGKTDRLGMALEMAGKEREAVELFLDGYGAGSLERRAAEYIVEGMPYNMTLDGKELGKYLGFYHLFSMNGKRGLAMVDSIEEATGKFSAASLHGWPDIRYIDPEFVGRDMKLAFDTRMRLPWCRHVSDSDFVRYVVPYRIGDERVMNWRDETLRRLPWMGGGHRQPCRCRG